MRACLFLLIQFCASSLYAASDKAKSPSVADPVGIGDFLQVFLGLAVIVIAILAMAWVIKRTGYVNTRASGQLKVIGGLTLTQRERLLLVQVGKKQILLGIAPGRISTLHELEENIDLGVEHKPQMESFAQKLQSVLRGNRPE
ncbi:MAG: flagellar biosynthetic protein FliO [Thioalkalispiraceae bacterium]|jgi:flagellar protein FliO/FliZ